MQTLVTRKLKRATEHLADEGKKKIKRNIADFFADAEDLLMRYLPEFDSRSFVKSTQNKIQMDMEAKDLFSIESESGDTNFGLGDTVLNLLAVPSEALEKLCGIINHGSQVAGVEKFINSISADFDPKPYLETAFASKETTIEFVKGTFITELIEPLQEQIKEIREKKDCKEKELQDAQQKREQLEAEKSSIAKQIAEMSGLRAAVV